VALSNAGAASLSGPLQFKFAEALREIEALITVGRAFLENSAENILDQFRTNLANYQRQPTFGSYNWQIARDQPIYTRTSERQYERGAKGSLRVFAAIDGTWPIRRLPIKGAKRTVLPPTYELAASVSTRVRILEAPEEGAAKSGTERELAMWRFEIGDAAAPGCHFHIQILGQNTVAPFPSALSVPRLPTFICTLPAVVEYTIAELFQDGWPQHVSRQSALFPHWSGIQRTRLSQVLRWQLDVVSKASHSPWTSLKLDKPKPQLFIT
jgi:hypothetical protein